MTDHDPPFSWELTVGELAKRSGVAVSALRFYEDKGLLVSRRNDGNQRRYARAMLRRVAVIKVAQRLGIPLASVKQALAALPTRGPAKDLDWTRLSARWRKDLDERIELLTKLRDQLDTCIGCGCLTLESCPLRNPGDTLAQQGPGPHLLEPSTSSARGRRKR